MRECDLFPENDYPCKRVNVAAVADTITTIIGSHGAAIVTSADAFQC
jgi:hypothetical protein